MKKLFAAIVLFFALCPLVLATSYTVTLNGVSLNLPNPPPIYYYVTATGAGNNNGLSLANAFAGFANLSGHVNWTLPGPRTILYICGTIHEIFNNGNSNMGNGIAGYPITFDGSCPGGSPGVLDGGVVISSTWTSWGSNIYSTPMAVGVGPYAVMGNNGSPYGIITEDDNALIAVPWNTDINTTSALMISTAATYSLGTWTWDPTNGILYVLTTGADDPTGHTMETSTGQQYAIQFNLSGHSNFLIQNLTLKNAADYGFDISNDTNITLNNCTVYNIDNWAIFSQGSTNVITSNSTFHHIVWQEHTPFPANLGVGEGIRYYTNTGGSIFNNNISADPSIGIDLITNTTGVRVYGNIIHDNLNMTTNYSAGIYSDNANGNFIYGNMMYNYLVGISLNGEATNTFTSNTYVYNNLVYNWYRTGIYLGGGQTWTQSENNYVYNNTLVVGPSQYVYGQAVAVQGSVNDTFKNNIVFGGFYTYSGSWQTLTPGNFDYNQYLNTSFIGTYGSFSAWQAASGGDVHSGVSSPSIGSIFAGSSLPPASNFELVSGASPIQTGINLYSIFQTDYDGGARQSSGSWDVGAYVYP